ncbi:MAG TPA: anti-sigma regulatory factor [Ruminococcaceae bacterium]|jgi:anti-sigma regulatory factor (Ser/Thr protein kinase)|nr:anti-sigma regulatory factor [Oscillospiraceae bacterium]HCA28518.1 anti-sigma regulatory factor [Oscillospiraceae bacterium]
MKLHYKVPGDDFTRAGEASGEVKRKLKRLGFDSDVVRRMTISIYEAEINMAIHAGGGVVDVEIMPDRITAILTDDGPGIPDLDKAMQEGWSTAPDNIRSLGFGAGMGLPNIKKYTDILEIDTVVGKGTTLTMAVLIKPE